VSQLEIVLRNTSQAVHHAIATEGSFSGTDTKVAQVLKFRDTAAR
jgi:hypothetical protein